MNTENKKNKNIIIGAVGVVIVAIIVVILAGSKNTAPNAAPANQNSQNNQTNQSQTTMETKTLPDGLQITDEVVGTGTEAVAGDMVTVNYVGTLTDGKVFDASANHGNQGFSFVVGANPPQVIEGWNEGIIGMKIGGKRKLVIPPSLGYGSQDVGNGLIPPNSTLIFEVELLSVKPQG